MIIYTDGHLLGNNNLFSEKSAQSGYTKLFIDGKEHRVNYEKRNLTNNEAEIIAIIHACFYADEGDTIVTDSQYAYGSIVKNWRQKEIRLANLIAVAKSVLALRNANLIWERREKNLAT